VSWYSLVSSGGVADTVLSESARRPGERTDGVVGKTLEVQFSNDIMLIKEEAGLGEDDDSMQLEEA
jgi:hypothetical protein